MKCLLLLLLFIGSLAFAELPSVLEYQSGMTIADYTVVEWKKTSVIVKKGQGGPFPVTFSTLIPEQREIFEAEASRYLTANAGKIEAEKAKKKADATAQWNRDHAQRQAVEASKKRAKAISESIRDRKLIVGMTPSQVIESWGKPDSTSIRGGATSGSNQWVYYKKKATHYIYFRDGRLRSWSTRKRH